ncbi:hypothetical protein [Microbaculum marinum]|uniref:Uncharacterized protein n=1 Tax=Microbaculum marinum TaxID=1764581 RepID=A0AAW9RP71_9HYPH
MSTPADGGRRIPSHVAAPVVFFVSVLLGYAVVSTGIHVIGGSDMTADPVGGPAAGSALASAKR